MTAIRGVAASQGIAIGPLFLRIASEERVPKVHITDTEAEIDRVVCAKLQAEEALEKIYQNALHRIGETDSMIFQIHIMMLRDEDFFSAICEEIHTECVNAEYAVWQASQQFSKMFSEMDDEYMRGRAADIQDICHRLLCCLDPQLDCGESPLPKGKAVIAAVDLMPSETVQMDKTGVLAFATQRGSKTSHTAILARTMGIPAVVGLGRAYKKLENGVLTIVDGSSGCIIQEPDKETLRVYQEKQQALELYHENLLQLKGKPAVTKSGRSIVINANISRPEDVALVKKNDAQGIGLFRSEFLYMDCDSLPTEEEQFQAYRTVLEQMEGKEVVIRTFDLGADKHASGLRLQREDNPAMGYRAIRICLNQTDLFLTQLRALVRASAYGQLSILFPMLTSLDQIQQSKAYLRQVQDSLAAQGIPFDPRLRIGAMIETPASVVLSDLFAREVDFFSIGTNDLTQYTLAVDRMNPQISDLYDPRHLAVLRMIEATVKSAKAAGIPVGICGESAADLELTKFYLEIGVDELSVAPDSVLELRRTVRALE